MDGSKEEFRWWLGFWIIAGPILCATTLYIAAISYTAVNAERVNEKQEQAIKEHRQMIDENQDKVLHELFEIKGNVIQIREILKHKGE
jgi:hypothetical protein